MTEWGSWNEANHKTQPTSKSPRSAAQFYGQMRKLCTGCTIVALDVLDQQGRRGLHQELLQVRRRGRGTRARRRHPQLLRGQPQAREGDGQVPGHAAHHRRGAQGQQEGQVLVHRDRRPDEAGHGVSVRRRARGRPHAVHVHAGQALPALLPAPVHVQLDARRRTARSRTSTAASSTSTAARAPPTPSSGATSRASGAEHARALDAYDGGVERAPGWPNGTGRRP